MGARALFHGQDVPVIRMGYGQPAANWLMKQVKSLMFRMGSTELLSPLGMHFRAEARMETCCVQGSGCARDG